MHDTFASDSIDSAPTRRQVLATGATALAGGGTLLALGSGDAAAAEVTMGELSVSGDDATVSDPPETVTIAVSGEWAAGAPEPPEQARTVLQIHQGDSAGDLAEQMFFEQSSGEYSLSANLYDHRNIASGDLTPATPGESASWDLVVRVILLVVEAGEITAEEFVEDTATLTLTRDGYGLSVGGTGSVTVA